MAALAQHLEVVRLTEQPSDVRVPIDEARLHRHHRLLVIYLRLFAPERPATRHAEVTILAYFRPLPRFGPRRPPIPNASQGPQNVSV
jgi:hypothetical protein